MLRLSGIYKDYYVNKKPLNVLKGLDLAFPKQQFVTILGPSGCGKTTLLNLIGGLDKYTAGDLIIEGRSTKQFKDSDWDAYRNHRVGFVFQSYNLIPHLSVLENVEISLTLSGTEVNERQERAKQALIEVGLESELYKRPNQLSGGQMQRVAIARALVNNPSIILADEPTGALDTKTSAQVISLLKEVSKERLVIMVSHNEKIAQKYSDRIIRMLDGKIIDDTKPEPLQQDKPQLLETNKGTSMSFSMALKSSFKNILTKKGRTLLTSLAGSLGIIGIGLVAAVSNGFSGYIDRVEAETMASYPLAIFAQSADLEAGFKEPDTTLKYPDDEIITAYDEAENTGPISIRQNIINQELIDYVKGFNAEGLTNSVMINYPSQMKLIAKRPNGSYMEAGNTRFNSFSPLPSGTFTQMPGDKKYMMEFYDLLGSESRYPTDESEVLLVIDAYNRVSLQGLKNLGILDSGDNAEKFFSFDEIVGKEFKLVKNDEYFIHQPGDDLSKYDLLTNAFKTIKKYRRADYGTMFEDENIGRTIKISGIMRSKKNVTFDLVTTGIAYTPELSEYMQEENKGSEISEDIFNNYVMFRFPPAESDPLDSFNFYSPYTNTSDPEATITIGDLLSFGRTHGAVTTSIENEMIREALETIYSPVESIAIFPKDSASKKVIKAKINEYNKQFDAENEFKKIKTFDAVEIITNSLATLVDIVSIVLIVFTSISLVVSGFLIGIITYVSVIERTKEIGILRALGARKKDISRLFNAETFIIGSLAGFIGVTTTYLLSIPINLILNNLFPTQNIGQIAFLAPLAGIMLIVFNIVLTVVAGLIPSRIAAKRDPVVALRTE